MSIQRYLAYCHSFNLEVNIFKYRDDDRLSIHSCIRCRRSTSWCLSVWLDIRTVLLVTLIRILSSRLQCFWFADYEYSYLLTLHVLFGTGSEYTNNLAALDMAISPAFIAR